MEFNLGKLEAVFSNDLSSSIYVILADEYLKKNDLSRAYTVVKIGLEKNPDDIMGKYILGKIYLFQDNLKKAQQLLEEILAAFPLHLNARQLVIAVYKKQNNNDRLNYHIGELQKYFPDEGSLSQQKLNNLTKNRNQEIIKNKDDNPETNSTTQVEDKKRASISMKKNMITFTFVDILISQKHFVEALDVLNTLEKEGRNKEKINQKREEIKNQIKK